MTTLVTGSNGLVGFALRELMPSDSYFATRNDADLTNFDQTMDLFSTVKPSRVIHLAALVGGIGVNQINSAAYFMGNLQMNINTLEAARIHRVEKFVSFMSTCVFPDNATYPLKVSSLHQGPPHPSNFGYAYAKRMLEVQTRAYRLQWGLNYSVGIPANIFGPNDNFHLEEGHVIPALIHKFFIAAQSNTSVSIWGSGNPLREFVYSKDIAHLALWMLDKYEDVEPLILSSDSEISIRQLVKIIVEEMGFSGNITFDESKPDGQYRKPSDSSRLKELYPAFEFSNFRDSLRSTIQWFQQNYPNVRGVQNV